MLLFKIYLHFDNSKSIDKNSFEVETKIKQNKVGQGGSKFSNQIMFIQSSVFFVAGN